MNNDSYIKVCNGLLKYINKKRNYYNYSFSCYKSRRNTGNSLLNVWNVVFTKWVAISRWKHTRFSRWVVNCYHRIFSVTIIEKISLIWRSTVVIIEVRIENFNCMKFSTALLLIWLWIWWLFRTVYSDKWIFPKSSRLNNKGSFLYSELPKSSRLNIPQPNESRS